MSRDVDIVVVGAGIAGSATARALAREGRAVALLEQFELGHARGSSHGTSRIFRLSYPEERYVLLAQEALEGWRELEVEAGEELILRTGSLDFGAAALANTRALAASGVRHEQLAGAEVSARWGIAAESGEPALFQPDGGITLAERACAGFLNAAEEAGAEVREHTRVTSIDPTGEGVLVATDDGDRLRARVAVVTAGAWAKTLLSPLEIALPVTVTRESVAYFAYERARELPTLIDPIGAIHAYGLAAPGVGLKAGLHRSGAVTDPNAADDPDVAVVAEVAQWVARRYPGAEPQPLLTETCLYTSTSDESFVLERHGRVVVGSACSGHGFKFAPVIGARLARLAVEAL